VRFEASGLPENYGIIIALIGSLEENMLGTFYRLNKLEGTPPVGETTTAGRVAKPARGT
jgi:hypothetical protein